MERSSALQAGLLDLHLSYSLFNEENSRKRFSSRSNKEVIFEKPFDENKVFENQEYLYFKPTSFANQEPEQKVFLERVKLSDKNVILDLTDNGGGDNWFAHELVKATYLKTDQVPQSTKIQLTSGLMMIGLCFTLLEHGYDSAPSYCSEVKDYVSDKGFDDLLLSSKSQKKSTYKGERTSAYSSRIIILIDSSCASSCETVVEKMTTHKNVLVVGENTAGALHFSNAMTLMLPNSGIIAKIPTLYHEYEFDGEEGKGYSPEYQIEGLVKESQILEMFSNSQLFQ